MPESVCPYSVATSDLAQRVTGTYRKVVCLDAETNITYEFLTNAFNIPAATVAELYKKRWQIELFLKWIKQNLRVKRFLGT